MTRTPREEPWSDGGRGGAPAVLVDVVDTRAEAQALEPPPLIIREVLRDALAIGTLPSVERIDAGHSNPTFLVDAEGTRLVLRRPPRPPFAPKAHDVMREYRILSALRDQPVRTPMPVLARTDTATMGAPFYLMEAIDGLVMRDSAPPPLDTPEQRAIAGAELIDALAELHAVDPLAAGLGDPARGAEYLQRQVKLWAKQWTHNQTRSVPALDEVTRRLERDIPDSPRISDRKSVV